MSSTHTIFIVVRNMYLKKISRCWCVEILQPCYPSLVGWPSTLTWLAIGRSITVHSSARAVPLADHRVPTTPWLTVARLQSRVAQRNLQKSLEVHHAAKERIDRWRMRVSMVVDFRRRRVVTLSFAKHQSPKRPSHHTLTPFLHHPYHHSQCPPYRSKN